MKRPPGRSTSAGAARSAFASVVMLAAVVACRDSSSPSTLNVSLQATVTAGPSISASEGGTRIRCEVRLQATAAGEGVATWLESAIALRGGRDRTQPISVIPIPEETIADIWGSPTIDAGATEVTSIAISTSFPYSATLELRYRTAGGRSRSTEASVDCGPRVPANSAPPTITSLSVQPGSGLVEPGQSVTIAFTARSDIGFLSTRVQLSGACDHEVETAELMPLTLTGNTVVTLPQTCRTDRPLLISVQAADAALEVASQQMSMMLSGTDITPPSITPLFFPRDGGSAISNLEGRYFIGDSIHLMPNAYDNRGVAAFVWEVLPSGIKDSITTMPDGFGAMKIPVRASWGTGPVQLRFHARDAAGNLSTVYTSAVDAVRLLPTSERTARIAAFDGEIRDVAVDARRGLVYVLQSNEHRVAVLSLATLEVTRTIALPAYPTDFDITPLGDSLLVALPQSRALGVIDLREEIPSTRLLPLTILDQTVQQSPHRVRSTATGRILVSLQGSAPRAYQLAEIDLATGVQRLRLDAGDGGNVGGGALERSHDGSIVVLQGGPNLLQRYDASVDRFGVRSSAIPYDFRPSVDGMGLHVAVGGQIYGETLLPLSRVDVSPCCAPPGALAPDGQHLYLGMGNTGVIRARTSDGAIVDRLVTGILAEFVRVSSDGRWLITAERTTPLTGRVSVTELW